MFNPKTRSVMKKYIYILIAVMTAILVSSCGASKKAAESYSNNPYSYDGEGYSNISRDIAIEKAIVNAYSKLGLACDSETITNIKDAYKSNQGSASMTEREIYDREIRIYSDVVMKDVVLDISEIPWRQNKNRYTYAYGVKATVDNSNITSANAVE